MWDLPRPGLEPVSPALAGRFSTTAPPGKPWIYLFELVILLPLDKYLEKELLDHMVVLLLFFEEPPYCFPQWLHQFTFPPRVHKSFLFSSSLPTLLISCLLKIAILTGVRWNLIVVFFFHVLFFTFYESTIALQCCVCFYCITKWISYMYTYIPISPPSCVSLPPSLSHPSRWSQSTELISLCYAVASH